MDYLFKNDIIAAKQILIDEIFYLFVNEYKNYNPNPQSPIPNPHYY